MRKRNIQIIIRLDKDEHRRFQQMIEKSGLSQTAYIRHMINGLVPSDLPPPDYYNMMRELHRIGRNLNQIAQKAHLSEEDLEEKFSKEETPHEEKQ